MESIVGGRVKAVAFTHHNVILCNEGAQTGGMPENAQCIRGTILVLGHGAPSSLRQDRQQNNQETKG